MKPSVRKLLSALFIVGTLGVVIVIAFSNDELSNAWETLFTLNPRWLFLAALSLFLYYFFDVLSYHYFLRKQKTPVRLRRIMFISLMGFYYSNITPGASGGQPMQVYYMNKAGVPVGVGSSAVSLRLFCNQLMVVAVGGALWLLNANFVNAHLSGMRWAIIIGFLINFAAVPLVLLAALHRTLVQAVLFFLIRVGAKLRLIKDANAAQMRVNRVLDSYHSSILRLGRHPGQILTQMLLAGLSMLSLMAVPIFVYRAFGLTGTPWYHLLTASYLLYISASYTPLPGASGAQEGGFLVFFRGLFTSGTVSLALLVWRFITYYSFIIVGALVTVCHNLRRKGGRDPSLSPDKA